MLMVDYEKAFDSVSLDFILTTLDIYNFGDTFKDWIRILLGMNDNANFKAITIVNGNISERLNVAQGCRQGDPISGYLFILAIKILALSLKKSKAKAYRRKGGNKLLVDIYADDLSIYLRYDTNKNSDNKDKIIEVLNTIERFYKWSGLKVNRGKTQLTIFGRQVQKPNLWKESK